MAKYSGKQPDDPTLLDMYATAEKQAGQHYTAFSERPVVFDFGFNHGQDSWNYLEMGYRVIAIEANPALVAKYQNTTYFKEASEAESFILLNYALVRNEAHKPSKVTFYVNMADDERSEVELSWCKRPEYEPHCIAHSVPATSCADLFANDFIQSFGDPFYVKLDVEGQDANCIRDIIQGVQEGKWKAPKYISSEQPDLEVLAAMRAEGYSAEKKTDNKFWWHSSGPFGEFANDVESGGRWKTHGTPVQRYNPHSWMDVHFKRVADVAP
jgi:FkbM family methyltransferase